VNFFRYFFCVAPLKEFIPNVKSSPAMLDLEQTLKELCYFVKRLTDDKEKNIQEILTRKKEISEEIHKILDFILIISSVLAVKIIDLRFNLPSLPNLSTFFSSSFVLEIK
jgi:hypothetical protein